MWWPLSRPQTVPASKPDPHPATPQRRPTRPLRASTASATSPAIRTTCSRSGAAPRRDQMERSSAGGQKPAAPPPHEGERQPSDGRGARCGQICPHRERHTSVRGGPGGSRISARAQMPATLFSWWRCATNLAPGERPGSGVQGADLPLRVPRFLEPWHTHSASDRASRSTTNGTAASSGSETPHTGIVSCPVNAGSQD